MLIKIDKNAPVPIHDQIKDQIMGLIHARQLQAGDQLPTIRALSIELAVNFNTVAHAYHELDSEGVIETRRGAGTFVAGRPSEAEMDALRAKMLEKLVASLLAEAQRLGYTQAELRAALAGPLGWEPAGSTAEVKAHNEEKANA
jgi:GntR family transcriptional regulator